MLIGYQVPKHVLTKLLQYHSMLHADEENRRKAEFKKLRDRKVTIFSTISHVGGLVGDSFSPRSCPAKVHRDTHLTDVVLLCHSFPACYHVIVQHQLAIGLHTIIGGWL